jgi:hypothetical protein
MKKNLDTIVVSAASAAMGGTAAYSSAVGSMGIIHFLLWKIGLPVVALSSGPVIMASAVTGAVVGGGAYGVWKGISNRKEKLKKIAKKNDFQDGSQDSRTYGRDK